MSTNDQSAATGLDNELAVYTAGLLAAAVAGYGAIYFLVRYLRNRRDAGPAVDAA